jgi:hypothetical protein
MRDKIFGGIGILWGGAVVFRWLTSGTPDIGSSAYQTGHSGGVALAALMLMLGLYYFFRKPS